MRKGIEEEEVNFWQIGRAERREMLCWLKCLQQLGRDTQKRRKGIGEGGGGGGGGRDNYQNSDIEDRAFTSGTYHFSYSPSPFPSPLCHLPLHQHDHYHYHYSRHREAHRRTRHGADSEDRHPQRHSSRLQVRQKHEAHRAAKSCGTLERRIPREKGQ